MIKKILKNPETIKKIAIGTAIVVLPGVATGLAIYFVGRKLLEKARRKNDVRTPSRTDEP